MKTRFVLTVMLIAALAATPCFASESAYELYTQANELLNTADSVQVKTDMNISMEIAIEEEPMSLDITATGIVTVVMKSQTDMDMKMEMSTSLMGMDIEMFGYYTDGMMYMDSMGQKSKMEMPIEDALKQANMINIDFDEDAIKDQSVKEVEDGTEIEFILDAALLSDEMMGQLGSMGDLLGADMDLSIGDIKVVALLDSDGMLTSLFMEFSAAIGIEDQEMDMSFEVSVEVLEIGGLEVELPDDLDEYEMAEAAS